HGDIQPLPEAEVEELLGHLAGAWDRSGPLIRRHIQTRNFAQAFALATRVALLAEREGHHPELQVGWGHLVVELTTHAAGGLTRNDFIMAAKVDRVID
ncbi:Transcriptional coactivator/pterin dehydratase, partial [mine drainage metagenome]